MSALQHWNKLKRQLQRPEHYIGSDGVKAIDDALKGAAAPKPKPKMKVGLKKSED